MSGTSHIHVGGSFADDTRCILAAAAAHAEVRETTEPETHLSL